MGPHDVFIKYLRINQGLTPEHYRGIRKTLGEFLCEDGLASDNVRSLLPIVDCVVIYFRQIALSLDQNEPRNVLLQNTDKRGCSMGFFKFSCPQHNPNISVVNFIKWSNWINNKNHPGWWESHCQPYFIFKFVYLL